MWGLASVTTESTEASLVERVDRLLGMAREKQQEESYAHEQERGSGDVQEKEERVKSTQHSDDSQRKDKRSEEYSEAPPDIEQPPVLAHAAGGRGRTYYFTIPIRSMTGHIPEEALNRLTLYYTLYGIVFAAVGAISIVLPLVFGVGVQALLAWLLVLGGSVTLLMFLLICGAPGTTAFFLLSGLHLAAGLYLLLNPPSSREHLIYLLAGWFILHGVLKIFMSIAVRKISTWPVVLVSGVASIVLAFVIVTLTSRFGTKLISITFGADLAFTGLSLLLISIMGFLGKSHRSVTDADLINEPFLGGRGHAASSA